MTSGRLQEVVSAFAVAGAYLIFAWLDRSAVLAGLSAALAVVPAVALASSLAHPGPVVAVVTGLAILVTGIVARRAEQQGR
jgi:CHASE2 domain-containing sensor protein